MKALELKHTSSGLALESSPRFYRTAGASSLVFGILGTAAGLAGPVLANRISFGGMALLVACPVFFVTGVVFLLFANPLAARRAVLFDTRLSVVRRAAGGKSVLFRAVSGVRISEVPGAVPTRKLELLLRTGDIWTLHTARDDRGLADIGTMADEIARVTGIPRA